MRSEVHAACPATARNRARRLYDEDGWTWAMEQAEALRRHDMDLIDWDNVIEEIEDVGMRCRNRGISHCANAIEHRLAIEYYDPAPKRVVNQWGVEVLEFRRQMAREIQEAPGLSGIYDKMFAHAWEDARSDTVRRLAAHDRQRVEAKRGSGTFSRFWKSRLPLERPYTLQAVSAASDHRTQDDPRDDVWPPSVARFLKERYG